MQEMRECVRLGEVVPDVRLTDAYGSGDGWIQTLET